ncbi:pilus assembly protein N-terminal domain-containing protein [candidate division KSB1 bacterium]|nr:pilus assembly protein N-terminal domain-containing protein [candidate division KSB1 bacterium]
MKTTLSRMMIIWGILILNLSNISFTIDFLYAKDVTSQIFIANQQSVIIEFNKPIKRISITNPEIADATVILPTQLLVNGKKLGSTSMIVWNSDEKYDLFKVIVHSEASTHQITLLVRFAEVNRNVLKEFGVDFLVKSLSLGSDKLDAGSYTGKVSSPANPLNLSENVSFFLSLPTQNISAIVKALEEKNLLTILAKPNLSAINGAEASFLAGGEFPIPIISGSAGMQSISIQFKEFGIRLKFIPTILDSELVNIKVGAEVSSLDFENGITLSGFRVPSLKTRRAETTVELKKEQYLIIGGLLSQEIIKTISKIPILGNIPVLGKLFTSARFVNNESELLIMVSPQIIKSLNGNEIPEIQKF